MEDTATPATVLAAEVSLGTGVLAGEPITTATLREDRTGNVTTVRIVGGPTKSGFAYLAGYVVPSRGARVRLDLKAPPKSASLLPASQSWQFNTPKGIWPTDALPVVFELATPLGKDVTSADTIAELQIAARTWALPTCTAFRASADPIVVTRPSIDDGINTVRFHDDAWPAELVPGALAQTIVHLDGSGSIHDTDIHLNSAAFRFSVDDAAITSGGFQDLRGVLVHEIGHALGIGHSEDPRASMNASGSGLRWRSLELDDKDAVCILYPGVGLQGCTGEAVCPEGYSCIAGTCQRPKARGDVCSPCAIDRVDPCEAAGDGARCVAVGSGANAGWVCGRSCKIDADCGSSRFICRPTSEAGDLQCLSDDSCMSAANTCATDADCTEQGTVCRSSICVVPRIEILPDAGADAASSDPIGPTAISGVGGACGCVTVVPRARPRWSLGLVILALLLLGLRRRR